MCLVSASSDSLTSSESCAESKARFSNSTVSKHTYDDGTDDGDDNDDDDMKITKMT